MNKKLTTLVVIGAALCMCNTAIAASDSDTMTVSATMAGGCTVSAASMIFPQMNPLMTGDLQTTTAGSLMIACTSDVTPLIWSDSARELVSAANTIPFSLGQTLESAKTNALPVISSGQAIAAPFVGNGLEQAVPLHGLIKFADYSGKPAGTYTAFIMINVNY
jgi:hypothetical protein